MGCPEDMLCELHKKLGKEVPCSKAALCKNFVDLEVPTHNVDYFPRLRHVMRLEAMINVGCQFRPEDLTPEEWDELIALGGERNKLDEQIMRLRTATETPAAPGEVQDVAASRKAAGVPAPGQSLFK